MTPASTRLEVKLVPGAASSGVAGWMGDVLKVRVTAPPERGRANAMLLEVLAEALGLPRSALRLASGAGSARKLVAIEGLDADAVRRRLPSSRQG